MAGLTGVSTKIMADQPARRLSIAQKLMLFMLLVAAIPLSLNWYVNHSTASTAIGRQAAEQLSRRKAGL